MACGLSASIGFGTKKRRREVSTVLVAMTNATLRSLNSRKDREPSLPGRPILFDAATGTLLLCGKPSPPCESVIYSSSRAPFICPEKLPLTSTGEESTRFTTGDLTMTRRRKHFVAPWKSTQPHILLTLSWEIST